MCLKKVQTRNDDKSTRLAAKCGYRVCEHLSLVLECSDFFVFAILYTFLFISWWVYQSRLDFYWRLFIEWSGSWRGFLLCVYLYMFIVCLFFSFFFSMQCDGGEVVKMNWLWIWYFLKMLFLFEIDFSGVGYL